MRPTLILVFVAFIVGMVVPAAARAEESAPPLPDDRDARLTAAVDPSGVHDGSRDVAYSDEALTLTVVAAAPEPEPEPPAPEPEPLRVVQSAPPPAATSNVRDRALAQFAQLGATSWQISVFDCIGWHESGWQSKRSNKQNPNGTYDHGPLQINQIHYPKLNALGLDPYVPEDAAVYAWRLSSEGHNFKPWTVAASCGV